MTVGFDSHAPSGFAVRRTGVWSDPSLSLLVDALSALETDAAPSIQKSISLVLGSMIKARVEELGAAASEQVLETTGGNRFTVDSRDRFAAGLLSGRLVENEDLNVFSALARPGDTVLDIGANFGLYSIEIGKRLGDGKVFAFEPSYQYGYLARNIRDNGLSAIVEPVQAAVASAAGRRIFFEAESGSFSGFTDTGRGGATRQIEVETIALDSYPPLSGRAIALMKLDVEGAELEVLKGAEGLIAHSPDAILLVEANRKNLSPDAGDGLIEWLLDRSRGLRVFAGFHAKSPGEVLGTPGEIEAVMSGNVFVVRPGGEAEARLVAAVAAERRRPAPPLPDAAQLRELSLSLVHVLRHDKVAAAATIAGLEADVAEMRERNVALEANVRAIRANPWWRLGRRLGAVDRRSS